MRAEELVKLDDERQNASKSRAQAQEAYRSAEAAEAKTYAVTNWNAAVEIWNRAAAEFGRMEFSAAGGTFASAAKQFETCIGEAKSEKDRREAEAMARAEKEVRERERRAKWRKQGEDFTVNDPYGLNMTMKWCPAGSFTMGSPATEEGRYGNEVQHQVTLAKGFWMGQTEVTQGQWKKIMNSETVVSLAWKGLQDDTEYMIAGKRQTLRDFWKMDRNGDPNDRCGDINDNVPVYNVNWHEAVEFCRRLTQRERAEGRIPDGYEYRLPTEAEWEYACRAGTTEALPNGRDIRILGENNAPALDDIAWYSGNSSRGFVGRGVDTSGWQGKQYPGGLAHAREVKGKQPNNWGLYDMIGNVWEWCGDWYGDYPSGSATDPSGATSGACRVERGESWNGYARGCRSATRSRQSPGVRGSNLGFRVALAPSH
jgi:formylglycine-generating enzyme required for sulfatase activity